MEFSNTDLIDIEMALEEFVANSDIGIENAVNLLERIGAHLDGELNNG